MLSEIYTADLLTITAQNKKLIERVPADKFNWKPHERSTPLGRLAMHIAELPDWITLYMMTDEFDFMAAPFRPVIPESNQQIMHKLIDSETKAVDALKDKSDDAFEVSWKLKRGDHIILNTSKSEHIKKLFFHITHHRGQLSVYLRLLDVPLPNLFGPTADER